MKTYTLYREKLLLMQERPLFNYNMFGHHHHQVDTKSYPLAIEGQGWQIAQNSRPSRTLSHENSFSHFTVTDNRFSDFEGSSLMKPRSAFINTSRASPNPSTLGKVACPSCGLFIPPEKLKSASVCFEAILK